MKAYRIRNWTMHFENSESKKVKNANWVPFKNKFDGKSFRRLARHENAVEAFCGWTLIVEAASKMPERGVLVDEDGPLTALDLADMTGFGERVFEIAIQVLTAKGIEWLESFDHPDASGHIRTYPPEGKGTEGTEGKGREQADRSPPGFMFTPQDVDRVVHAYPLKSGVKGARYQIERALSEIAARRDATTDPVTWLVARIELYGSSDQVKRGKVWSIRRFFEEGHYDDDPSAWADKKPPEEKAAGPPAEFNDAPVTRKELEEVERIRQQRVKDAETRARELEARRSGASAGT